MSKYTIDDLKKDCKALIEKAKASFTAEKVKFTEDVLTDGTTISYDGETPMANMPVFVLDQTGNQIPLADGVYTIADDGVVITVAGGVIAEVKGAEMKEAAKDGSTTEAPKPVQDMAAPVAQPKAVIESIVKESRFNVEGKFNDELFDAEMKVVKDSIEATKTENESLKVELSKQSELNKALFELVEKIADVPAVEPVTSKKEEFKKPLDKVARMMAEAKEFSKKTFN